MTTSAFGQFCIGRSGGQFCNTWVNRVELKEVVAVLLIAATEDVDFAVVGLWTVAPFLYAVELYLGDIV